MSRGAWLARRLALVLLLIPTLAYAAPTPPGPALPNASLPPTLAGTRVFAASGFSIHDPLAAFWQRNGGLAAFGLPLALASHTPDGTETQVFERTRLEYHPQNPAPYTVQLGLLGKLALEQQGRDWRAEGRGVALDGPCRLFDETQRTVCGPFLRFWQSAGLDFGQPGVSYAEALALFGLPLTAPQIETNSSGDQVLTQWFERARFEWHPANPPAFQVLLGRLGAEVYGQPLPPAPLALSAPATVAQGHTFRITIAASDLFGVAGTLGDWPLAWVQQPDGTWVGLGGTHAMQPLGALDLDVAAQRADGQPVYAHATVTVVAGGYAAERVILPPSVNDSIAGNPERVAAERAAVNALWPQVTPEKLWDGPFQLPADGAIESEFGTRRAYNDGPFDSYHEGLDIANQRGTPVRAAGRGRVVFAQDDLIVRGGAVILDHGWGVHSGYWHMDKVLAQPGQLVAQGDVIGLMGSKGFSNAPHVHWDLRIGALNVNPHDWLDAGW